MRPNTELFLVRIFLYTGKYEPEITLDTFMHAVSSEKDISVAY